MCVIQRSVRDPEERARSSGMCTIQRHVRDPEKCARSRGMCAIQRHVHDPEKCARSRGMCTIQRHVHDPEECARSAQVRFRHQLGLAAKAVARMRGPSRWAPLPRCNERSRWAPLPHSNLRRGPPAVQCQRPRATTAQSISWIGMCIFCEDKLLCFSR
jgi:hypothetical protein